MKRATNLGQLRSHRHSQASTAVARSNDRPSAVCSKPERFGLLLALVCLASFVANSTPARAGVVVDGDLSDWGISVKDSNASNFNGLSFPPKTGTTSFGSFDYDYFLEDTNDNSNNYSVGPNAGGQNFDAEFLGVGTDDTRLVIAIVSGQRPDNHEDKFSPGDIIINTDQGYIGVEVGGGYGHNTGGILGAIEEGAPGSTYALTNNGFTRGVVNSDGSSSGDTSGTVDIHTGGTAPILIGSAQKAGTVWKDPTLILDPIADPTSVVQQLSGGQLVGTADYYFSRDFKTSQIDGTVISQHSIIEVAIPYWMLSGLTIQSIEWAPSCGNDLLKVQPGVSIPEVTLLPVPEPSTLALLGMGGLGTIGWRRKRNRRIAV